MSFITIQTIAANNVQNQPALNYLEEYGDIFGQATRTAFSLRNRIGKTKLKESELEKTICKELEKRFGMSNSEARNVYTKASANYASQAELVDLYIEENFDRIKEIRRTIKKLEFKLKKADYSKQETTAARFKRKIHFKLQKIDKLEAKISQLKESKASGKFTVVFGSSKLFEKQYRLEENGYKNKEEWLLDWREARSGRSFFVGSKNYQGGNQLVRYDPVSRILTINVTPKLRAKYGDAVVLHGVSFTSGQDWLLAAIEPVKHTSTRKGNNGEKKETSRNGSKQPVKSLLKSQKSKVKSQK